MKKAEAEKREWGSGRKFFNFPILRFPQSPIPGATRDTEDN